jgi:hypothetical protein
VIWAPAITALVLSVTVPDIVPRVNWAFNGSGSSIVKSRLMNIAFLNRRGLNSFIRSPVMRPMGRESALSYIEQAPCQVCCGGAYLWKGIDSFSVSSLYLAKQNHAATLE